MEYGKWKITITNGTAGKSNIFERKKTPLLILELTPASLPPLFARSGLREGVNQTVSSKGFRDRIIYKYFFGAKSNIVGTGIKFKFLILELTPQSPLFANA